MNSKVYLMETFITFRKFLFFFNTNSQKAKKQKILHLRNVREKENAVHSTQNSYCNQQDKIIIFKSAFMKLKSYFIILSF
jgi:hypothetical protein